MQIRSRKYGLLTKKSLRARRGLRTSEKLANCRPVTVSYVKMIDTSFNWNQENHPPLTDFVVNSQPGNEIEAMKLMVEGVKKLPIPERVLERMKTAVAEAVMNAMEHGNHFQAELPVRVRVEANPKGVLVQVTDQGGEQEIREADMPDLEAKMAGLQSPRGWGLFLIRSMADEMQVQREGIHHIVTLIFYLPGEA